jgi:excisionase family DNA binding protein
MSPRDGWTEGNVARRPVEYDRRRSDDEILTSTEACRFLKIGRTKLWELTRRQSIPAYRVGPGKTSGLRFKRSELIRWLDGNRVGEGPGASGDTPLRSASGAQGSQP